mgnify:CR=1 FL=1|uniref:cysteine desulfurase n=1 Tax=candidate division CPR3 bacterium TaxID=2268181 RepID=A0A7C4M1C6_UNCC3
MVKKEKLDRVYLDYSATTPTDPRVVEEISRVMLEDFGNPSSIHQFGRDARKLVDKAREEIRNFINANDPSEIIFTSGGSESDNLAIFGLLAKSKIKKPHIITSPIEHKAILETLQVLEKKELIELSMVRVDRDGLIDLENLKREIKHNTILITIMYANNEIGTIQPIRDIGKYLEKINTQRIAGGFSKIYFHTDAVQAFQYLNMDVKYLHVDMVSVSGHKFYGPKGVGFIYVKEGTPIEKTIFGGGQEFNKRAGTENVPGICGMAKAVQILKKEKEKDGEKIKKLRDKLVTEILKTPGVHLTGHKTKRLPSIASFVFDAIEGESILINLDLEGIAVSTGSACTSGTLSPSHVLSACGYEHIEAQGNIRFSLGKYTTSKDIDRVLDILPGIVERLREMSPLG